MNDTLRATVSFGVGLCVGIAAALLARRGSPPSPASPTWDEVERSFKRWLIEHESCDSERWMDLCPTETEFLAQGFWNEYREKLEKFGQRRSA